MTLADRTIAQLRAEHETLTGTIAGLSDEQLNADSGAAEWSVATVLSHLGSGAEIAATDYRHAFLGEGAGSGDGFNQSVWDRWNALTPRAQADGFPGSDEACVAILESLDAGQRESMQLKLGFLPFPLSVAAAAAFRLHEVVQHSWDVRVAFDPAAGLDEKSAAVLLEHFWGEMSFLIKVAGKAPEGREPVALAIADTGAGLLISDSVEVVQTVSEPTARFDGPVEAFVRLVAGRLGPAYVPKGLSISGNTDLATLQSVFPGF